MSERESPIHTEDIELDEPAADAVVGGFAVKHLTPEQAFKQGYEAIAVMRNGTLMKNYKTGKEIIVPDQK
ncbi:MAG: hypothetical protein ACRDLP_05430 [Solirubrobacteraceae bacterium]